MSTKLPQGMAQDYSTAHDHSMAHNHSMAQPGPPGRGSSSFNTPPLPLPACSLCVAPPAPPCAPAQPPRPSASAATARQAALPEGPWVAWPSTWLGCHQGERGWGICWCHGWQGTCIEQVTPTPTPAPTPHMSPPPTTPQLTRAQPHRHPTHPLPHRDAGCVHTHQHLQHQLLHHRMLLPPQCTTLQLQHLHLHGKSLHTWALMLQLVRQSTGAAGSLGSRLCALWSSPVTTLPPLILHAFGVAGCWPSKRAYAPACTYNGSRIVGASGARRPSNLPLPRSLPVPPVVLLPLHPDVLRAQLLPPAYLQDRQGAAANLPGQQLRLGLHRLVPYRPSALRSAGNVHHAR